MIRLAKVNRKKQFEKTLAQREIEESRIKAEQAIRSMLVKAGVLNESDQGIEVDY